MKKISSKRYFSGIQNYEQLTGQPYGSRLNRSNAVSSNDKYSSQFIDYSNDESIENYYLSGEDIEDNSPGIISTGLGYIGKVGKWYAKQAYDLGYGLLHPGSMYNMFQEKRVKTNLTSSENELSKANINLEELEKVQDYINDVNELKQLSEQYRNAEILEQRNDVEDKMRETVKKIKERDEYFATEGKKSWILTDMFFDPDKADMSASEIVKNTIGTTDEISGRDSAPLNNWNPFKLLSYDIKTLPERLDKTWNATNYALNNIFPNGLFRDTHGNFTKDYIMRTNSQDRSTDKWFKSYLDYGGKDIENLLESVNYYKQQYERDSKKAENDVRYNLDLLQNGAWFFNPNGIDPTYRFKQENKSYGLLGFLNPANYPYSFSELGSSWGDVEHMFGSMAVDAAIGFAAKKIATKANPYLAGASLIVDGIKAEEALKNIDRIRKAENFARNVNFVGGALAAGSSVYFTKEMRRWETNSEAMDGYSNRVLNTAMDKNLNIDRILRTSDRYLNSIGINTDGLNDIERTQLALAFNSPTGDDDFEELKTEARDGLTHLINSNNALAFVDYIEVLPYMHYTKSFLREFGGMGFRKGANRFLNAWIQGDKELKEAINPTLRAEFDRQIDRVAKKWIKNPKTQLRLSHGSKFLSKKAEQLFPLMTKEGIEEGQQYLLQQRYERGEYDGENMQESMFDLPSLIDTGGLAADAVAGYIGFNFGDPNNGDEELRKSMEIGAMTALWFRAPHALTNLVSDKTRTRLNKYLAEKTNDWIGSNNEVNTENIRNLFAQFRNDKVIGNMVAENYGKNEDDEHVGIFFDSFSKRGVNRDRLAQSLEDFKKFKGPGVTDEFIEKDIKLLNTSWNIYNNQLTGSMLEDLGVERNSSKHKNFVQLATRAIIDADNARQIFDEDAEQYKQHKQQFIDDAVSMIGDIENMLMFAEADKILGTKTYSESPNGRLAALVKYISDIYDEGEQYRADLYNTYTLSEQARTEAIAALKKEDKDFNENAENADDRIAEKILEIADKAYNISKEDFVRSYMEDVLNYHMLLQSKKVRDLFKNREKFLELVQKELGVDINYERLSGMIHELDKSVEGYQKRMNNIVKDYNALRVMKGKTAESLEEALKPYEFDMLQSMDKTAINLLINNALYRTLNVAANAYILGQSDPNNLRRTQRRPSWNLLTQEQKDYYTELYANAKKKEGIEEVTENEVAAQYNKERREYKKRMNQLRKEYNEAIERKQTEDGEERENAVHEIQEIMEEAAKLYVESELQTKIDRKKIAHQEWLEDRPTLYDDFISASKGNKKAENKVKLAIEQSLEPISTPKPKEETSPKPKEKESAVEKPKEDKPEEKESSKQKDKETKSIDDRGETKSLLGVSSDEQALRNTYFPEDSDNGAMISDRDETGFISDNGEFVTVDNVDDDESNTIDDADNDEYSSAFDTRSSVENVPGKIDTTTDHNVISFNYVDQTFFFNQKEEEPPKLQIGGKPVKLLNGAELKSPAELSQKLVETGWFEKTQKYYVIAGDTGHVDMSDPDSLVVCLIIQDGKNAYATFMRGLAKKYKDSSLSIKPYDGEQKLIEKFRHQKDLPQYVGEGEEAVENRIIATKEGRRRAFLNHNTDVANPTEEDINKWYVNAPQDQKDDANDEVRKIMAGGIPIHTERHIRKQILKLREARQKIIDTCVQKDKDGKYILLIEGYKHVEPEEIRISNGKINVQEKDGKHTFRKLTDGGFGMSSDPEVLTNQLKEDKVEVGVGVGKKAPEEQQDIIVHVNKDKQGSWDPNIGVGKAGKLYVMVTSPNGNKVPIMVREADFSNEQDDQENKPSEAIDENGVIRKDQVPTIAEFIFRVLTHTFDARLFGMDTPDPRLLDELLELLVNNGEHTIINKKNQKNQQYLAEKQLWFDSRGVLHIALPDKDGMWKMTKLTKDLLFDPKYTDKYGNSADENRNKVIAAIAKNFHWNTERESLVLNMSTAYSSLFKFLKIQFAKDKNLKEYTFFGIKDLTFRRDDLFDENLKPKKISHLAWMFVSGKLLTDVGDTVFRDPFVFAQGTKPVAPAEEARYQATIAAHNQKETITVLENNTSSTQKSTDNVSLVDIAAENIENQRKAEDQLNEIVERIEKYDKREKGFTSKEFGQHIIELINTPKEEARKLLDEAGFEDAALLNVPVWFTQDRNISDEELEKSLIDAIARYVDNYNKTHEKQIKISDFKYDIRKGINQSPIWKSEHLPVIAVMKDGTKLVVFMDSMQIMHIGKGKNSSTITGVYSGGRGGSGKVNSNTARSWIQEAFGLTEDQVIITNAILKSTEGKEVFGVTQASADLINDEARVQFIFSKNAGHGIQFHEAFHYVNLLLHNKAKRELIYDIYRKHHLLRRSWSNERIEEALAEQFRRYALMRTDRGILPFMKRLFNNVLDFTFQYRKRTLMRQIYNDILRGGYKGRMLDKESFEEFKKAYPRGAASMDANIPNVRRDITDNFKAINSYSDFYRCAESLSQSYIHFVLSQTVENTVKSGADSFQRFLEDLKNRTLFGRSPYIQDVLDNPIAFKYQILGTLKKYGIKGNTKSLKKYQLTVDKEKLSESAELREQEDRYENTWDIDHFELSVKDNVAFRAKLFLSQIPKGKFEGVDRRFVPYEDELLGTQSYYSYDESWRNVMDNLSNFSTFDAIKKEVKRLSKTSAFFYSLNNVLNSIEGDIELENQLASAIKKQTAKITFLQLSNPKQKKKYNVEEDVSDNDSMDVVDLPKNNETVLDQNKQIDIVNDNTLGPLRTTLREWSLFAYSSGLFGYSETEKANVVDSLYSDELNEKFLEISNILKKKPNKITEKEAEEAINKVFPKLLSLLNKMGIPFDETVLNIYIDDHIKNGNYGDIVERYIAIKSIIDADSSKGGTIKFFIKLLVRNLNESQLSHSLFKNNPRALYDLYNGYKVSTEIGRMAKAYNAIYPNSSEHSVTVPGGKTMYPTNENNTLSDTIRWTNENFEGRVDKMLDTPYAKHSVLLNAAKSIEEEGLNGDLEFKLNLFVGMKDNMQNKGEDYFGITPMEDTISKMMMINGNMLVLPTMADKKSYYTIELISRTNNTERVNRFFKMPHDLLSYNKDSEDGTIIHRRFSRETLDIFIDYFIDELLSLKQYYKRENIEAVVRDPNKLKQNFHGKVSNGRMDFSGNGGLFRYFYDLFKETDELGNLFNINQLLEFEYKRQQLAEDPESIDGVWWIREGDKELDGFELVRRKISEIEELYFGKQGYPTDRLYDDINKMLFARIDDAMIAYSMPGNNQLLNLVTNVKAAKDNSTVTTNHFIARAIPRLLLLEYKERFNDAGIKNYTNNPYKYDDFGNADDLALSVIGNYVVGQMISIIEFEKAIIADPAFYKYKYSLAKQSVVFNGVMLDTSILLEKDTDKIKRLGSVLSPGAELRTDYPLDVLKKFPELTSKFYTVANISDANAKSIFVEEMKIVFGKQILADYIRNNPNESFLSGKDIQYLIDSIYYDDNVYLEILQSVPDKLKTSIENKIKQAVAPYEKINVSDAQVLIRPELYRKIRIGLGEWSFRKTPIKYKDIDGTWKTVLYSDEAAYKILEEDGTWMSDPEKAAMVSKFEAYPLKMSYASNNPTQISQENTIAVPIYNKMAIFPVFKCMFRSNTGKQIYDRMNMEDNELDMIAFESAVKVGLNATRYSPYKKGTTSLGELLDGLNKKSNKYISKEDWTVRDRTSDEEETIAVEILNLDNLRMQLNTKSHEDNERAIGTQMFKIMFSNVYDNEYYGRDKDNKRKGSDIRKDIMDCINALTIKGVHEVKKQFYNKEGEKPDENKVRSYVKRIIENNDVGATDEEIIKKGNVAASLVSRSLIQQSASALVNSEVIDINTDGGSAIQQSIFGLVSYDSGLIRTKQPETDGYYVLNDGKELVWNRKDGSVEIMLSMNFFKSIVPLKYQKTCNMMRWWLVENDIIAGIKTDGTQSNPKPIGIGYRIPTQGLSSTFAFTVVDIIPELFGDIIIVPREFTSQTGSDFDVDKIFLATKSYKNGKLEEIDESKGDLVNQSKRAIQNRLLQNYIDIVTDPKSIANARASIDEITEIIKNDILKVIRLTSDVYAPSMYELTPHFQSKRKQEFSVGKSGIGPFALNITNLALTQYAHLTMDYGDDNMTTGFRFGDLDAITCEDENGTQTRISDWLSAIVNAHVDVAKNPYVFDLNVNKATYNHVNFLLRAGKGKSTFLFIAQPALKKYAEEVNSKGGMYGSNIKLNQRIKSDKQILKDITKQYRDRLDVVFKTTKFRSDEQKKLWSEYISKLDSNDIEWYKVFDIKAAENAIKNPDSLQGLFFQVFALKAFGRMDKYAQALSNLVRISKVDTKKFGNDLTQHLNFLNSYNNFIYSKGDVQWKITNKPEFNGYAQNRAKGIFNSKGAWTRNSVEKDTKSLYIFTDNTDRNSGKTTISDDSWYSLKYGKGHHYPSTTQAVIRGLDNARPISTQHWYHKGATGKNGQWTDKDYDEFVKVIDSEIEDIKQAWDSGKYERIIFGEGDGIFGGSISEITEERVPMIYDYLYKKIEELKQYVNASLGIDNIEVSNSYTPANNVESILSLEYYFSSTFLNTKLFSAVGLTRDILQNQLYSATDVYRQIYSAIMQDLFGSVDLEINGYPIHGYEEVMDSDMVSAIGTAIENIMHAKVLFKYGDTYSNNDGINMSSDDMTYEEREEANDYTGPIDFTFGGDVVEAKRQIKRLFLGDKKAKDKYHRNSLFVNMAALMERMKNNPTDPKYTGLVDPEGRIINELLAYLRPTPATEDHPVPRMLFSKSKINTSIDEKSKLSSSFDFLLNHPNKGIRMLARDIALYAYYSTYNTNTSSSFFDLVPYDFRRQYDAALAHGLVFIDSQSDIFNVEDIIDIMCRNYYNDDNIVPLYNLGDTSVYINKGYGEYIGEKVLDYNVNQSIPVVIITSKADSKYIKINQKGHTFIYKKIRRYKVEGKTQQPWYGYILTLKLGRHSGTTHQYEFLATLDTKSMFEENEMPLDFDLDTIKNSFDRFEENSLKKLEGKTLIKEELEEWTQGIPNTYSSNLHRTIDKDIKDDAGQIIVSDKPTSEYSTNDIDTTKSIEIIASQFDENSKKSVSISFSGTPEISVKKNLINDYINEQVSIYQGRIDPSTSPNIREQMIKNFIEKVRKVAEDNVRQRLLEDKILNIISELQLKSVDITSAYVSIDSPIQRAAYKVLYEKGIIEPNKLFVISKQSIDDSALKDIINDKQLVLADDEELTAKSVTQFINDSINAQKQLTSEAQLDREDNNKALIDASKDTAGGMSLDYDSNLLAAINQLRKINIVDENKEGKSHEGC